ATSSSRDSVRKNTRKSAARTCLMRPTAIPGGRWSGRTRRSRTSVSMRETTRRSSACPWRRVRAAERARMGGFRGRVELNPAAALYVFSAAANLLPLLLRHEGGEGRDEEARFCLHPHPGPLPTRSSRGEGEDSRQR